MSDELLACLEKVKKSCVSSKYSAAAAAAALLGLLVVSLKNAVRYEIHTIHLSFGLQNLLLYTSYRYCVGNLNFNDKCTVSTGRATHFFSSHPLLLQYTIKKHQIQLHTVFSWINSTNGHKHL